MALIQLPDGRLGVRAVDSSYDHLTLEKAQCLKEQGWDLFIQALTALPATGLHQPAHRVENLQNAHRAGLATAGYFLLAPGLTGAECFRVARNGVSTMDWDRLKFVAPDMEVNGLTPQQVLDAANAALIYVPSKVNVLIYTSWNAWVNKLNNSDLLSSNGFGLWNASWDNEPDIDYARYPFGGWNLDQVCGEQWSGGTVICNQSVDQNLFYADKIDMLPVSVEEDNMIDSRFDQLIRTFDGTPKMFRIRSGNEWRTDSLKVIDYIRFQALGWLDPGEVAAHEHAQETGVNPPHTHPVNFAVRTGTQ